MANKFAVTEKFRAAFNGSAVTWETVKRSEHYTQAEARSAAKALVEVRKAQPVTDKRFAHESWSGSASAGYQTQCGQRIYVEPLK